MIFYVSCKAGRRGVSNEFKWCCGESLRIATWRREMRLLPSPFVRSMRDSTRLLSYYSLCSPPYPLLLSLEKKNEKENYRSNRASISVEENRGRSFHRISAVNHSKSMSTNTTSSVDPSSTSTSSTSGAPTSTAGAATSVLYFIPLFFLLFSFHLALPG